MPGPALTTYRSLRGTLLAIIGCLLVAVVAETIRTGSVQDSISAYYYTAAGRIFVAATAAMGVCLVALRGYTDAEDVFLNLAGISAPMIGFVPTPREGVVPDQVTIAVSTLTYLSVLALGSIAVLISGLVRRRRPGRRWPSGWGWFGFVTTWLATIVGVAWVLIDKATFADHAHLMAAGVTFGCTAVLVLLNTDWGARTLGRAKHSRTRFELSYWIVFALMIASTIAWVVLDYVVDIDWPYVFLCQEVALLLLFVAFWILQTIDLDASRDSMSAHRVTTIAGTD